MRMFFPPLRTMNRKNGNPTIATIAATGVSYGALIVRPIVSASSIKEAPAIADIGITNR